MNSDRNQKKDFEESLKELDEKFEERKRLRKQRLLDKEKMDKKMH
jgi:hypothetical protein